MKITKRLLILLLIILILFHIINNYIILKNDTVPIRNEPVIHYLNSLRLHSMRLLDKIIIQEFDYPPLFYYSSLPLYLIFGTGQDTAPMTNLFYLIILIFSVYGIGKQLHSSLAGLLSSFIVSTFIPIFGFSRLYMLEFALTALVALSIYLLLKTEGFSNKSYSILFGISCGLGMLIKWNFSFFIIGPLLFYLFQNVLLLKIQKFNNNRLFKRKIINICLSILVLILVTSCWYPFNTDKILRRGHIFSGSYYTSDSEERYILKPEYRADMSYSLKFFVFMFYIKELYYHQIGYLYFIFFLLGFFYFLFISRKKYLILFFGIIIPYFVCTLVYAFSTLGEQRFIMPFLPLFAIIIALLISNLKNVLAKKIFILIILFIGFYQFFALSYGNNLPFINEDLFDTSQRHVYVLMKSDSDKWNEKEITQELVKLLEDFSHKQVNIAFFNDFGVFDIRDFDLNIELYFKENLTEKGILINVFHPLGECGMGSCLTAYTPYLDLVLKSQIIITDNSTGSYSSENPKNKALYSMKKAFNDNSHLFELVKKFELPEDNIIYIYKRK